MKGGGKVLPVALPLLPLVVSCPPLLGLLSSSSFRSAWTITLIFHGLSTAFEVAVILVGDIIFTLLVL
ncbi:hypothetical protein BZA77DRAFT_310453 [Pyronema omphalodes]|nr:hypothetical protein BZA77DRAFT_310453 [Pyronema omphalodes]